MASGLRSASPVVHGSKALIGNGTTIGGRLIPEAVFLADRVIVMTARPGKIAETIPVDIARPRSLSTMGDEKFVSLTQRIRKLFYVERSLD